MAFNASNLNNIASSIGNNNLWLYTTIDDNAASVKTSGHFDDAVAYSLRTNDVMIIKSTDAYFMCYATVTAGVVTLSAFDAF